MRGRLAGTALGSGPRALAALLWALAGCASPAPDPVAPAPAPPPGFLVVRSNVYGDRVAIDGEDVGPTGPRAHAVGPGTHRVAVSKDGYLRWVASVDVAPGETRTLRARLRRPPAVSSAPPPAAGWDETVDFLRRKLRERWESGEGPRELAVSREGVMAFRLRNPVDADVWHHYALELREVGASVVDGAPTVLSLHCAGGSRCIRERLCRGSDCFARDAVAQQRWFFSDAAQAQKVRRAFEHLRALARNGAPPLAADGELF